MGIRIGVDVGEKSLGLAVVDYDDEGWPVRVLAAVSHLHDGGMDPETAMSPNSRMATSGIEPKNRIATIGVLVKASGSDIEMSWG